MGPPHPKSYMGWWGSIGSPPQKGIARYAVSAGSQKLFHHAFHNAIFNTFRRVKNQIFFVVFPVSIYYYIWTSANNYNQWLYTKAGHETLEKLL
ncbi:uncharacterized protein SAPINGB_P005184 [Magnusiomyces paraingens]|uniref:Cytochrome b-c1 complex subunit 8 n=1 Tax=Magnusiomyces paraingens TaxID=2606893 RepID=A0A5E8C5Y8_9ASCO|nr:uncharacterized protein SAPINGB_P005184 [Saprochaete ingens]VVT56626.1 unnamed protein product [Saprochaete ingens]